MTTIAMKQFESEKRHLLKKGTGDGHLGVRHGRVEHAQFGFPRPSTRHCAITGSRPINQEYLILLDSGWYKSPFIGEAVGRDRFQNIFVKLTETRFSPFYSNS